MYFNGDFKGKKVLITAGPTREALDPVRYISNHSSGKMGYSIASAFLDRGAEVILVVGPTDLHLEAERLKLLKVVSAAEMLAACLPWFREVDIVVFAAAVADYRPADAAPQKIKKNTDEFTLRMTRNKDIAYEFGRIKAPGQYAVGFALETNDELAQAIGKMDRKNLDIVVLNSLNDVGAGFGGDTNKITILTKKGTQAHFPLKPKAAVAQDILEAIVSELVNRVAKADARQDRER